MGANVFFAVAVDWLLSQIDCHFRTQTSSTRASDEIVSSGLKDKQESVTDL